MHKHIIVRQLNYFYKTLLSLDDDFYWRQKSSSLNLVQIIPPVGLLYYFRNPPLVLASSNVTFGSMIVYGIRLSPNNYVLVLCFGMPFQEVPIFPFSVFDFFRLPGQYSIMIK